jgi:glucose-6-phosphate isomerase
MTYTHDIKSALEETIGKEGANKASFADALSKAEEAVAKLKVSKADGSLAVLNLPEREDDLALIEETARHISSFKTFVVIGMGGSSYGAKALCALAYNPFALAPAGGTILHFIDNIDPLTSDRILLGLDLSTTIFAIISKSGDTAETLAHALILIQETQTKLGDKAVRDHFIAITEPKDSALRRLAEQHCMTVLDHDAGIGGRFSVLSNVGLLPAKVAGLNIRAIRKGAAEVIYQTFSAPISETAKGAALNYALMQQGRTLAVLMPYCDRLDAFNTWYRQLWAESLGKGGKGTTPMRSLGACDQHSQLQLYLDGPRDKFISLILLGQACKGAALPTLSDPALAYLSGHTLGDLMEAEQRATAETLTRNQCPLRVFNLKQLDEETMGALMMHFMLETMIMGELLGVNTFDQPAVEEGKKLAREYLAKKK